MGVTREITVEQASGYWVGKFRAMGSPCEILAEVDAREAAELLSRRGAEEAWRIEEKFSRYRDDNLIHKINNANGEPVEVDSETADLIDYAAKCYELSDGRFDVTSGVLRRAWKFDKGNRVPDGSQVKALMPFVGWEKVRWERPRLTLAPGMEIDLGGIAKEYAVDRAALLLRHLAPTASIIVNFGGDLYVTGPRADGSPWDIGVEDPRGEGATGVIHFRKGGMATSGDAHRYVERNGVRYSHILDPRTGNPIMGAPRAVTVVANTCLEAGTLSTFAMLHGAEAQAFLEAQEVPFWVY